MRIPRDPVLISIQSAPCLGVGKEWQLRDSGSFRRSIQLRCGAFSDDDHIRSPARDTCHEESRRKGGGRGAFRERRRSIRIGDGGKLLGSSGETPGEECYG